MIIRLKSRGLVSFKGAEVKDFLNDLITADITGLPPDAVQPSILLTPQGRVLFDMLISCQGDDVIIEIDASRRDAFIKKMTLYRMRRDVEITPDGRSVYALAIDEHIGLTDRRFAHLGVGHVQRYYGERDDADDDETLWRILRYHHAIAEGAEDLPPEQALPLEAGLDEHGGISFDKGCYIGQEVTARTRYRGLLKRRYKAVSLGETAKNVQIATPCDLKQNNKNAGHLLTLIKDGECLIGLASVRLDAIDNLEIDNPITADGHHVTLL